MASAEALEAVTLHALSVSITSHRVLAVTLAPAKPPVGVVQQQRMIRVRHLSARIRRAQPGRV